MATFKYAISGGTGWLGQELIYSLIERGMISDLSEIIIFSSKERKINFRGLGHINTHSFLESSFGEINSVDSFVHLAFLTRNLIPKYGLQKYIEINRILTSQARRFIEVVKPGVVVNVSSGAVFSRLTGTLEDNIQDNPYGVLKLEEERELIECCQENSANLSIGRLWGATGRRMPINRAYAISDFISQAFNNREIKITSSHAVWRRYCDASEFMVLLLLIARKKKFTLIDSGGPRIEIGSLAELIAKEFGSDVLVMRNFSNAAFKDDYFPRSNIYEELSSSLELKLTDLPGQIRQTISGHLVQLLSIHQREVRSEGEE